VPRLRRGPANGFLPQAARCCSTASRPGPGIRVDSGVVEGSDVPVHYDPLLAKLIVHAETRDAAIARALAALRSTRCSASGPTSRS
jgi:acetyl/propionyl-CoA carboxylase alpha subunit